jgi:hypothetical protein
MYTFLVNCAIRYVRLLDLVVFGPYLWNDLKRAII